MNKLGRACVWNPPRNLSHAFSGRSCPGALLTQHQPMRLSISASLAAALVVTSLTACDKTVREGDLKYICYRYLPDYSAYVSIDSKKSFGDSFAISLNAVPHLKIHGSWCELTWTENNRDGSKEGKKVCFPVSNIHSFKWKE
jgi:hypothetical protein